MLLQLKPSLLSVWAVCLAQAWFIEKCLWFIIQHTSTANFFLSSGSHWSGQKLISLSAHRVHKQIFHTQLLQSRALKNEQIRNDSGSETGASWLVDEVTTINMVMSFGAFSIKAANSTKRCRRV